MRKRVDVRLILAAIAVSVVFAPPLTAQGWDSYAVKFVCGAARDVPDKSLVNGKYRTMVNVHNPHYLQDDTGAPAPVTFLKKVVLAQPQGERMFPPSCLQQELVDADHAVAIDCGNIRRLLALSGLPGATGGEIEGFVVLLVPPFQAEGVNEPPSLDVQAVYTGRTRAPRGSELLNGVSTWDIEIFTPTMVIGTPVIQICDRD